MSAPKGTKINCMGPILGQDMAVLLHSVVLGPHPHTKLWEQHCRAAKLPRLKMSKLLLARHGHGVLFYPMSLLKMHFLIFFFFLTFPPISFSQVMQFPPNTVLEKDLQRIASDCNSCSVGCSLPGYLIY